jgi:hypothetical protein
MDRHGSQEKIYNGDGGGGRAPGAGGARRSIERRKSIDEKFAQKKDGTACTRVHKQFSLINQQRFLTFAEPFWIIQCQDVFLADNR